MKKVLSVSICFVLLLVTFVVTLTGCGSANDYEPTSNIEVESSYNEYQINEQSIPSAENEFYDQSIYNTTISNTPKCIECGNECEEGHSYCSLHECWEHGCTMQQKDFSSYCVNHSCLFCGNDRANSHSPYCSQHKCSSCDNVVVEGSYYCVAHKCLLCDEKAWNDGYCTYHDEY